MRQILDIFRFACAVLLLTIATTISAAGAENSGNVLLLHSDSRLLPAVAQYDGAFLTQFHSQPELQINVFEEFLDLDRMSGTEYEAQVAQFLINKYKLFPIHVVVVVRLPALRFVLNHRNTFLPNVPIVYSVVSAEELTTVPMPESMFGSTVKFFPEKAFELARAFHTDFKRALVISGTSPFDLDWLERTKKSFARYESSVPIEYWQGPTSVEMMDRLRNDSQGLVIFTMGMMRDGAGNRRIPRNVIKEAADASQRPVYTFVSAGIGAGPVGTYAPRFEDMGHAAGKTAIALLTNNKAALSAVPKEIPCTYIIDENALRRFDVPLSKIPQNSIVLNHEPSLWEQHKAYIILALLIILTQAALIGALLVQRRYRRAVQLKLDEQLQIERKFADVSALLAQGSMQNSGHHVPINAALECLARSIEMNVASFTLVPPPEFEAKTARWITPIGFPLPDREILNAVARTDTRPVIFHSDSQTGGELAAIYSPHGMQCAYHFPVNAGGRLIGVLGVYSTEHTKQLGPIVLQQLVRMAEMVANAAMRDVSAEALRESERNLAIAAEAAKMGLWSWDLSTNEIWSTERTRAILGYASDTVLTMEKFETRLHADDLDSVRKALKESLRSYREYRVEFRLQIPEQSERWVVACGRTIKSGSSGAVAMTGTIADISESKVMHEKVDRLRRELEHISRVNMLGELSAALAHELNQPLAAILSNAQAARRNIARNAVDLQEFSEILDDIIESDKRAGEVIRRMRLLLQKGDHCQEVLLLNDLIQKIVELLNADIIEKNVRMVLTPLDKLPKVRAGRVEITQVMMNLVVNALEAMASQQSEHERILSVSTIVENESVIVTVSDTGPGVPAEMRKDVFRPFFTTKTTGLGMGLSICERILEVYGGRLWVEEPPDNIGARFRFSLPVYHEKGAAVV